MDRLLVGSYSTFDNITFLLQNFNILYADIFASQFSSSYNSMQLQFKRRVVPRIQALISYTWSHSIDLNRGSSDFDIRHSLNGTVLLSLPSPRDRVGALFLRNWTADSIFFARSAPPIDLETVHNSSEHIRPDLVPGEPLYLKGSDYPGGKALNPAAFSVPPESAVEGDLGRNVLRAFGAWQIDFALHRTFKVSERTSLQFRAEAFNVLNHANFANPSDDSDSPQRAQLYTGRSTSTLASSLGASGTQGQLNPLFQIGGPRSLQFALRLKF